MEQDGLSLSVDEEIKEPKIEMKMPEIKVKMDDAEILEVVKPVVKRARFESVKKMAQLEGKEITEGDRKLIERYARITTAAIRDKWMDLDEVNETASAFLVENPKNVEAVVKFSTDEAREVLRQISLSGQPLNKYQEGLLVNARNDLILLEGVTKKSWKLIAEEAGADIEMIDAMEKAGSKQEAQSKDSLKEVIKLYQND